MRTDKEKSPGHYVLYSARLNIPERGTGGTSRLGSKPIRTLSLVSPPHDDTPERARKGPLL